MDILEFIEKLRKKSEASRRRIAVLAAFFIAVIIAIVWLTTMRFPRGSEEIKKAGAPFAFIKEDVLSFYKYSKEAYETFKNIAR